MNKLQDYLQKMEATKKAVGTVKGGKFKQKEGTPKVGLNFPSACAAEQISLQDRLLPAEHLHHFMTQLWYEAKDEDGNIFYYHIKTSESR